jgi:hypothetical protein
MRKSASTKLSDGQTIAAVVLNEEVNIERCLHSVAWADGVVDTESGDRTVELASVQGARIVVHRQGWDVPDCRAAQLGA